jgi:hypothetical protein
MALSFRPGDGESCCPVFGRRLWFLIKGKFHRLVLGLVFQTLSLVQPTGLLDKVSLGRFGPRVFNMSIQFFLYAI